MDEHTYEQSKQEEPEQREHSHEHKPTQMFRAKSGAETITQKLSWKQKLKDYLIECKRVLKVTKKPNRTEFQTIVKISGLGIIAIGLLGFLIYFIKELLL